MPSGVKGQGNQRFREQGPWRCMHWRISRNQALRTPLRAWSQGIVPSLVQNRDLCYNPEPLSLGWCFLSLKGWNWPQGKIKGPFPWMSMTWYIRVIRARDSEVYEWTLKQRKQSSSRLLGGIRNRQDEDRDTKGPWPDWTLASWL